MDSDRLLTVLSVGQLVITALALLCLYRLLRPRPTGPAAPARPADPAPAQHRAGPFPPPPAQRGLLYEPGRALPPLPPQADTVRMARVPRRHSGDYPQGGGR